MSELYELPEGWEWKKLRDTLEFSNKTVIIDNDDEYNCIGLEHIESNTGRLIDFKPSHGLDIKSSKVVFEKGMVLYGKLRPYLNKVWKAEFSGIATTEILPFKTFSDVLNSDYLAHYLRSNYFVQNAMNNISGARMPRITTKYLKNNAFIPITQLQEQKRIVAKLDSLFEKIDRAIVLHQKNMDEADVFMGSVLNDVFGEVEGKYETASILSIMKINNQTIVPNDTKIYNYVGLENIESNSGKLIDFTPSIGKNIKSSKVHFKKGMVLYGKLRPYLNKVWIADFDGIATTEILPFFPIDNNLNMLYVKYYFLSPKYLEKVMNNCSGSRMPRLTTRFLKSAEAYIPLPPLKIQQKTVNYLDKISLHAERVKELQKEKMEHLKALKASILDQAFRGKL